MNGEPSDRKRFAGTRFSHERSRAFLQLPVLRFDGMENSNFGRKWREWNGFDGLDGNGLESEKENVSAD